VKKAKKVVSLLLIFTLTVGATLMTGCGKKEASPAKAIVVTVNDKNVYLDEVMYYISAVESTGAQYEAAYQQYTGSSYWDQKDPNDPKSLSMRDQAKNYVLDTTELYEILYDKAVKGKYTLTDEEKTQAGTNADQIIKPMSKDQLKVTGFTKDVLVKVQEKLTLSSKYYKDLVDSFKIDDDGIKATIKREDYKQYKTEYLFVPTKKYDENYKSVDLSADEKAAAKTAITAALDKVKAGEEFAKIKEADDKLTSSTLDFVVNDGTAEKEYQKAAMKLDKGAYSTDVIETPTGYYIIKMVDNNATDAYDKAVSDAIAKAEDDAFKAEYEKMKKDYKITVNNKVWDPIVIGNITIPKAETTGNPANSTPAAGNTTDNTTSGNNNTGDSTTDNTSTENATTGE
jgi:foldase protein PrsA